MNSIAGSIVVLGACWLGGCAAQLPRGADVRAGLFVATAIVGLFGLFFMFSPDRAKS